jgi:hypothetical protein
MIYVKRQILIWRFFYTEINFCNLSAAERYTAIGGPGEAAAEPSPGRWSGTDSERVVSG